MHIAYQKKFLVRYAHSVPKLHFGTLCTKRTKICFWYALCIAYQTYRLVRYVHSVPKEFWYDIRIAYQRYILVRYAQSVPKYVFGTHCTLRTKLTIWYAMYNAYNFLVRNAHCVPNLAFATHHDLLVFSVPKCNFGT